MILKETKSSSYFSRYIYTTHWYTHSIGIGGYTMMWIGLHHPTTKVTSEERTRTGW